MSLSLTAERKAWGGMHGDRVRYRNEGSALRAIQHGMEKPDPWSRLETVRCEECGGWHAVNIPLPPLPVPPPRDMDKAGRMCITKKAYPDEGMAQRAARQSSTRSGYPVRCYPCPMCGLWHLSKSVKE